MSNGGKLSAVGGALALVSFALLPYLSFGLISITGWQIASAVAQYQSLSSGNQAFALIWLTPIAALATAGLGVALSMQSAFASASSRRFMGLLVGLASLLGSIPLVQVLISGQPSGQPSIGLVNFLGFGYWLSIIGLALGLLGAIMTVRAPDQ